MKYNKQFSQTIQSLFLVLIVLFQIGSSLKTSNTFKYKSLTDLKKLAISLQDTQTLFIKNSVFSNIKESHKNTFTGSVLITPSGELSFADDFLEDESHNGNMKIIARARYTKSLAEIGWSRLYVETFDHSSPEIQSWAAGFLEGKLTAMEILYFYKNLVGIHQEEESLLGQVFDYYTKVENFIRKKTSKTQLLQLEEEDLRYWTSVAMIQAQTDGLLNGYNSIMKDNQFGLNKIYFINADGEVPELIEVFKQKNKTANYYSRFKQRKPLKKFSKDYLKKYFGSSDSEQAWLNLMMKSHCSAVIKLIYDDYDEGTLKDIMVGHTTWDSYSEMQRVYKVYKFSFTLLEQQENPTISFSSYAGTLTSTDDFYVLNSGLVVLETTLEILDRSLYVTDIPSADEHVPNYIRISVANRLAKNGKEWTELFKKNNSGTYNSQWMVIDLNKLKQANHHISHKKRHHNKYNLRSDKPLDIDDIFHFKQFNNESPGLFHLLEQIPGYIEVQDLTPLLLKQKYWGSYNRPFFPEVFKRAGYESMVSRYGNIFSFDNNARALLIKSRINNIYSIEDLKGIMQSNLDINNEPGVDTLSPRFDIKTRSRVHKPSGGIDTKITNLKMGKNLTVLAISGPTHLNVKPFSWDDWSDKGFPHYGLPTNWNFDWVKMDKNFVKNLN